MNSIFTLDDEDFDFSDEECMQAFDYRPLKDKETEIVSRDSSKNGQNNLPHSPNLDKENKRKFKFKRVSQNEIFSQKENKSTLNNNSPIEVSQSIPKYNVNNHIQPSNLSSLDNIKNDNVTNFALSPLCDSSKDHYRKLTQNEKDFDKEKQFCDDQRSALFLKNRDLKDGFSEPSDKATITGRPKFNIYFPQCEAAKPLNKRKFPGPAGALPELANVGDLEKFSHMAVNQQIPQIKSPSCSKAMNELGILSTADPDDFKQEFWLKLQRDAIECCRGLAYHSIAMVHHKAAQHRLNKGKVPLMCALIKSFSVNCTDASVILRDPTGEIKGTVHQQVLERSQSELVSGGGIALKQVSVFSPSPRKHYVNITPSNILFLVHPVTLRENMAEQSSQILSQRDTPRGCSTLSSETSSIPLEKPIDFKQAHTVAELQVDDDLDGILCELDEDEDLLAGLT